MDNIRPGQDTTGIIAVVTAGRWWSVAKGGEIHPG